MSKCVILNCQCPRCTIKSLKTEVERYRDALRAIRDENFIDLSNPGFPQAPMMRKYAREALKQEDE